jgi:hypothetical protein
MGGTGGGGAAARFGNGGKAVGIAFGTSSSVWQTGHFNLWPHQVSSTAMCWPQFPQANLKSPMPYPFFDAAVPQIPEILL